ncbi:MAG: D-beta-D-heptose 7-phosphate kinase / D-beta-D-heptose 1-phosphate adenosyltransferase [Kribbellaceae bacterium]|nr:D-beta-D-heptose 7-phosphate kinase / D-beta-D-heptose 1-phosphate adenosyltransferase [Kribbellaceae bacterium]
MTVRVLVVGDVLLDRDIEGDVRRVAPDAPVPVVQVGEVTERAGGAGLAATLLAREGVEVSLITAMADDEPAKRLEALLTERVSVTAIVNAPGTRCKTRIRSAGQSLLRLDVETPAEPTNNDERCDVEALEAALEAADAVLVSDYGGGMVGHPAVRGVLRRWASQIAMVWDPHPRGLEPVPGVTLATPNRSEAQWFCPDGSSDLDRLAADLRDRWQSWAVAVTDGGKGVFTSAGGGPTLFTPTPFEHRGDACGAGDRFAGTVAAHLGAGATARDAVDTAVQDTADWLAAGGVNAAVPLPDRIETSETDAATVIRRVRSSGGTVVATGGCFDILHAGHIASLEAARKLGDALVVLVNSDDSIRRLKGADRPVNQLADRCRVLRSLRCVDAVAVFGGDDPCEALDQLRPDIWAKGGDYTAEMLPEAPIVNSWGGRVVLVPYLPGRSTTAILSEGSSR